MQLNMLTDLITRCHETSPCADEIQSFKVRSVSIASCFNDVWKPHTAFIFLNTFLGFCLVHGIEFVMNKSLSLVTFWLSFVETSFMFRVNIWSWHHIYRHILPNVLRRDHWRLEMLDSMGAFLWDDPDQDQRSRDHLDHGRSDEPTNPCPEWIHRFIWSTMIRVISDHWSWYGSSQRNAPMCFITIANGRFAVKHTCITVISTDLENKRRSQTIRECNYFKA